MSVSFFPAEATVAPEPSLVALIALAGVVFVARQAKRLRRPHTARLH